MKIFTNKKTKLLFSSVLLCILLFSLISAILISLRLDNVALYILICSLCMGISILLIGYKYFKEQNKIMENAITQITEYISGNQNARIECNEEGELYRLFHEVNSLVSILNAHTENEVKSKKFLKDTISNISHQLKTPLAALNIYIGIIQEEANDSSTIKEFTDLSEQELDRIEMLVKNLLKITKLDAGTIVIEKSMENLSEIMEYIENHFSYHAEKEGKKIQLIGDNTINISCDRNWIIEAIGNIVKNALDHTKKGNSVDIEWKQFTSVIQIIIKDNGGGIHPGDLHHIFKRFYRSRFSKDKQGIGLGLSIAKSIVELHGGTIEVDSELNIGTTFTLNFLIPTKL